MINPPGLGVGVLLPGATVETDEVEDGAASWASSGEIAAATNNSPATGYRTRAGRIVGQPDFTLQTTRKGGGVVPARTISFMITS